LNRFFGFGFRDPVSRSKDHNGDKGLKTMKFQNNKIMYIGFETRTLNKNLYLKPKGGCSGQAHHEDK
jgi:hypothetical protein